MDDIKRYFNLIKKNWYGLVIVYCLITLSIYLTSWSIIEPMSIPDKFRKNDMPSFIYERRWWHLYIVLCLSAYLTLIVDLILRKITNDEIDTKIIDASSNEEKIFLSILKEIGLIDITTKLLETKYEPKECMRVSKKRLLFMGISGVKWINAEGNQFEIFLRKIDSVSGKVRFLLINPMGTSYSRLKDLRDNHIEVHDDLLVKLYNLSKKYKCLKVKLYDTLPGCRLTAIDENIIAVSPYKLDKDGYLDSHKGWNNPHVAFSQEAKWSFYNIFERYYYDVWDKSIELSEYILKTNQG